MLGSKAPSVVERVRGEADAMGYSAADDTYVDLMAA